MNSTISPGDVPIPPGSYFPSTLTKQSTDESSDDSLRQPPKWGGKTVSPPTKQDRWSCRELCGDPNEFTRTFSGPLRRLSAGATWVTAFSGSLTSSASRWWNGTELDEREASDGAAVANCTPTKVMKSSSSLSATGTTMTSDRNREEGGAIATAVNPSDSIDSTLSSKGDSPVQSEETMKLKRKQERDASINAWYQCCHPRATDYFGDRASLETILGQIRDGVNRTGDPVLGDEDHCVTWDGMLSDNGIPVLDISKPESTGSQKKKISRVFVNRLICYLFASGESFADLYNTLPQEIPLSMACRNKCCVAVTHVSIDPLPSDDDANASDSTLGSMSS